MPIETVPYDVTSPGGVRIVGERTVYPYGDGVREHVSVMSVDAAAGVSVSLRVTEYQAKSGNDASLVIGDVTLSLSGTWRQDNDADLRVSLDGISGGSAS